jgi:tubulin polyglutamylase TTLL5
MPNKNICFELLGFDILLDSDMEPWLMEVNLSPSLATESPLDLKIMSNLFIDRINIMCLWRFYRWKENIYKLKTELRTL